MKRYILPILCLLLMLPIIVQADSTEAVETQVKDLKETVESIGLEFKGKDYKESDDQVVIYMFRMSSCDHCHDAVGFLNDIVEEYGDKFKLRSFEISGNAANNAIYTKVFNFLEIKDGVPLILIGENKFRGFNEKTKDSIKKAIEQTYEETERYDIFDAMEKNETQNKGTAKFIMLTFVGIVVIVCVIIFIRKK